MMTNQTVLILNCGSSSLKYAVFEPESLTFSCRGIVDRVGQKGTLVNHAPAFGKPQHLQKTCKNHEEAIGLVLHLLTKNQNAVVADIEEIGAVGHRVVHGGEAYIQSTLVTQELLRSVEELSELAPLHNPANLAGILAAQKKLPKVPHVAVFDTAFHQTMPPCSFVYALPYDWYKSYGIRRYGFHGTSHLYVSHRASALMDKPLAELKLITLHVGNGSSAAAVCHGRSIDTSMGFTPLEGLVMGTRCGWIDPAIPLYLMEKQGLKAPAMQQLLNKKSGLLGITGRFSDRRDILQEATHGDERCLLALEIEAYTLKKTIGAYAASMGGVDAVVFTAGVGENSPATREKTLTGLDYLGIILDRDRNNQATTPKKEEWIHHEKSQVKVFVIPTNEELVIAEDTMAVVLGTLGTPGFRYSFSSGRR